MRKLFRKITLRKFANCLDEKTYNDFMEIRGFLVIYKNHTWVRAMDTIELKMIIEKDADKIECIFADIDKIKLDTKIIIDTDKIEK